MRVAWPEKAIVVIAIAFGLVLLGFGAVLNGASATYGWVDAAFQIEAHLAKIVLLPLWIALRVVDLLSGGPKRRRRMVILPPIGLR